MPTIELLKQALKKGLKRILALIIEKTNINYLELYLDSGLTWTIFIPFLLGTTLYGIENRLGILAQQIKVLISSGTFYQTKS